MIRNVTIAAIVQRPNTLDILEILSNTSCVIRYWVVEDGRGASCADSGASLHPRAICRSSFVRGGVGGAGFVRCPDS